jgi:hypothetical protein
MHPNELRRVQQRWAEIMHAIDAAGIPLDELSLLAMVAGGRLINDRYTRMVVRETRPIGFAPPQRKEGE